jgi:hypothetical protein
MTNKKTVAEFVPTTAEEAGYEPGKGDAYDYVPQWMIIPDLYATEPVRDPLAVVKLFHPLSNWTWYIVESDGDCCFGLVENSIRPAGPLSRARVRVSQVVSGAEISS